MTTAIMNVATTIQAANAPTRPATTQQSQGAAGTQTIGDAVNEAIRASVNAQAAAARARAAAAAQPGVRVQVTPPTPPAQPGTFTIRGRDGAQQTFTVPPFAFGDNVIPQQAVDISIAFFLTVAAIIIGLPLARAFARRMDRRSGQGQVSGEITNQLAQLNQAVDAIALEVERISEGQRFTTRLLTESRDAKLPTGAER
jgi:hypothetical protein